MIITRLRLHGFKRHAELDVELGPGLNVIRGPNESGKSTVQRAIELGLFRRPTFASAELEEVRSWSGADSDPTVEIEFEDDGQPGSLRRVFAGQRGTVEMRFADRQLSDPAAVEQAVAELTGLPSEKFFRASASVHHQELGGLTQDENTLRDRLQQSMSGADRGTHAAQRKLEEAIRRYRTEGAKNPGYLKVLRTDVERLRAAVAQGEAALAQLEADRQALAETRARRADFERRLAGQREGAARSQRAAELTEKAADASRRYTQYKRAAELREEIAQLEAAHPSEVALPVLRTAVEQLRNLEFRLSEMRAELAAEPDLSGYDVAVATPRWRPWLFLGAALVVAALVAVAIGVAGGAAFVGVVIGAALLAAAGVSLFLALRHRRRLEDIVLQNELRESEIARRLAGRTDMAERIRQTEQDRAQALASIGAPDMTTAESTLAAETEHHAQISSRRAEYRGLMGDEPGDEDVVGLRDQAAAEADGHRHTLAGMGEIGRDPDRFLKAFQLAIQRLIPERDSAISAEAQAEARVSGNDTDAERVAADAEALRTAEEELAAAERRLRIYEEVLTALNSAELATMKKAARFLEQRMARDIERVTDGRYRRLKIDESTLTFSVYSAELDDWIDVRRLSQGTLDQLFLCARLGIVRQVTEPGNPPLLFDDPFVTFDEQRAERAMSLLKDIASDFQVIYLTASERYDNAADRVVVLPAPTALDEPAEPDAPSTGEAMSMWSTNALPPAQRPAPRSGNARPAAQQQAGRDSAGPPAKPAPLWPEER